MFVKVQGPGISLIENYLGGKNCTAFLIEGLLSAVICNLHIYLSIYTRLGKIIIINIQKEGFLWLKRRMNIWLIKEDFLGALWTVEVILGPLHFYKHRIIVMSLL